MRAATLNRFDSRTHRIGDFFLAALAVILLGYSIAGKGSAYIGVNASASSGTGARSSSRGVSSWSTGLA